MTATRTSAVLLVVCSFYGLKSLVYNLLHPVSRSTARLVGCELSITCCPTTVHTTASMARIISYMNLFVIVAAAASALLACSAQAQVSSSSCCSTNQLPPNEAQWLFVLMINCSCLFVGVGAAYYPSMTTAVARCCLPNKVVGSVVALAATGHLSISTTFAAHSSIRLFHVGKLLSKWCF